jgi:hypothetical protein
VQGPEEQRWMLRSLRCAVAKYATAAVEMRGLGFYRWCGLTDFRENCNRFYLIAERLGCNQEKKKSLN